MYRHHRPTNGSFKATKISLYRNLKTTHSFHQTILTSVVTWQQTAVLKSEQLSVVLWPIIHNSVSFPQTLATLTGPTILTFNPIQGIGREFIAGSIGSRDDDGVAALDCRGAAEIGAVVGALALRGDISCEKKSWRRSRPDAQQGNRPCGTNGREEREYETELEENPWGDS